MIERMDAIAMLRGMPDASVDAIVMDPPYCSGGLTESARRSASGQGLRSENLRAHGWFGGDTMGTQGLAELLRLAAVEARRVVRASGSMLVFADWRLAPVLGPAVESAGVRYQNLVVWAKPSPGLGTGFRPAHELIMHFTFGAPVYHDKATSNVLACGRQRDRVHVTQKPVELMRRLVRVVCPPGGLVVDPFCGSGSTGVAALLEGRRFRGSDTDPEHVETARARVHEAAMQALGAL